MSGLFITIEGPDGAGKTSLINQLAPMLEEKITKEILLTREPGGIPIAEKIREVILDPSHTEMDDRTEALLYAAARRQHLVEKVMPALAQNKVVLCDRFVDSSMAYQGAGRQIGMSDIASINEFACAGLMPDLTLYIDVTAEVGLARIQKNRQSDELDRLDSESLSFHQRVREGYLAVNAANPERIKVVNGELPLEEVAVLCFNVIKEHFPKLFK